MVDEILEFPGIVQRVNVKERLSQGNIIGTIILPRDLSLLSSRLPKPNYNSSRTE